MLLVHRENEMWVRVPQLPTGLGLWCAGGYYHFIHPSIHSFLIPNINLRGRSFGSFLSSLTFLSPRSLPAERSGKAMSTDLHLLHDLPKLRLQAFHSPLSLELSASAPSGSNTYAVHPEDHRAEEGECRTPTSEENRIPEIFTCPPAPKKPSLGPPCKRKLSELEFFEILNRAEVDEFFRRASARVASDESLKRRRLSRQIVA